MDVEENSTIFDTEKFILEVQSKPALWDLSSNEYANRDLKKKSWEDLVIIFMNNKDASDQEKNEYGRILQRKWKSLRDCYNRERQRMCNTKSGSSSSRKTPYVYFKQLSFLQSVVQEKSTSSSMSNTDVAEIEPNVEKNSVYASWKERAGTKRNSTENETANFDVDKLVSVLRENIRSREDTERSKENDDDRMFLLSLLISMKKIPEHMRFSVRMQMMQIIDHAVKGNSTFVIMQQSLQHNHSIQAPHTSHYDSQPSFTQLHNTQLSGPSTVTSPESNYSSETEYETLFPE